jgi:transcriptional regulator with XRE-family HTH domain
MELAKTLGNNLKCFREKLGYSQSDIAELLGVDRSTISKYELGEREISIINLNKLSDLYGIELEELIMENPVQQNVGLAFAFRKEGLDKEDLESIAGFQKIVKNYIKMDRLMTK